MDKAPQEIIDQIFEALCALGSFDSSVLSFSQVCRSFRAATRSFMLLSVRLPLKQSSKQKCCQLLLQYLEDEGSPATRYLNVKSDNESDNI